MLRNQGRGGDCFEIFFWIRSSTNRFGYHLVPGGLFKVSHTPSYESLAVTLSCACLASWISGHSEHVTTQAGSRTPVPRAVPRQPLTAAAILRLSSVTEYGRCQSLRSVTAVRGCRQCCRSSHCQPPFCDFPPPWLRGLRPPGPWHGARWARVARQPRAHNPTKLSRRPMWIERARKAGLEEATRSE